MPNLQSPVAMAPTVLSLGFKPSGESPPPTDSLFLLEDGTDFLLEDGTNFLLEDDT